MGNSGQSPARGARCHRGIAVAAVLTLTATVAGQTDWRRASPASGPPPREDHALATDPVGGQVLLFGGRASDGSLLADTWTWDGAAWSNRSVSGPTARRAAALAFHPASSRLILYGGYDAQGAALADTWEWDGSTWTLRTPSTGPGARAAAAAAGSDSGDLVLFGGADASGVPTAETWLWDGTNWTLHGGSPAPSARFGHAMAGDPTGGVVLFGGFGAGTETWRFAAGSWSRRAAASIPGPRQRHVMVHDPVRGRAVLHGGTDGAAFALADTWEWDGSVWVERVPTGAPTPRLDAAMALDPTTGRCLLFGGYDGTASRDDQWTYGATFPASAIHFGVGCAGSGGTPTIRNSAGLPWLGDAFGVRVTGLPASGSVQVHAGFSDRTWGGLALPFVLDGVGMPGCSIYASIDAIAPVANRGGTAELALPVPFDPNLLGLRLFLQALAIDPGANALGAVTSDGLAMTIGGR